MRPLAPQLLLSPSSSPWPRCPGPGPGRRGGRARGVGRAGWWRWWRWWWSSSRRGRRTWRTKCGNEKMEGGGGGGAGGACDGGETSIVGRVSPSPRSPCRPTPPHSSSLFANHAGSLCPAHRHHHRPPAGGVHAAGPARDAADTAAAGDGDGPLVSFKKGPGGGADAVPARCCPLGQDRPGIGPVCAQCEQGNQGTGNARGAPPCATGTARG
jgi:hypothetical protein